MPNKITLFFVAIATIFICSYPPSIIAGALDSNDTNRTRAPITSTVPAVSGQTDTTKMNINDWANHFQNNGMNTGSIGNSLGFMSDTAIGQAAFGTGSDEMTNDKLSNNSSLNSIASVGAFNTSLFNQLAVQATNNPAFQGSTSGKTISCYITRNIPYGYKCEYTGLSYSGVKYGNIDRTKKQCEQECFQQSECVNLELNPQKVTDTLPDQNLTLTNTAISQYTIPIDNTKILDKLTFTDSLSSTEDIFYAISYRSIKGNTVTIAKDYRSSGGKKYFYISALTDLITVSAYRKTSGSMAVTDSNITLQYKQNDRWFCPSKQDLTMVKPGDFSIQCPSGNAVDVFYSFPNSGTSVKYKICIDGKGAGDNVDGTYSTFNGCKSMCVDSYSCVADNGAINTESLQNFQEGCIEGQTNCSNVNKDCQTARTTATTKVLNEVVFDATQNSYKTVVSGVQLQGVDRPRILLDEQKTFDQRSQEEWKDKAYKAMNDNKTYNTTKIGIGDDTNSSNAYGIYLQEGTAYGYANTSLRSLIWKLKPKALDVGVGTNFYVYSVVVANVEYRNYDALTSNDAVASTPSTGSWQDYLNNRDPKVLTNPGNYTTLIDEVWWLKTSANTDTYKPFRRAVDRYKYALGENNDTNTTTMTFAINTLSAGYNFETFSGTSWTSISSGTQAEYMLVDNFSVPKIYYEYTVVYELGALLNNLPGLAKSSQKTTVTSGGTVQTYIQKVYTGTRDGTGDYIPKFRTYGIYSKNPLTYQDISDLIDNGTTKPFYEMGAELNYPKVLQDDSQAQNSVQIYLYGPESNASAFMNIKPTDSDVGKKGFIFVFIY